MKRVSLIIVFVALSISGTLSQNDTIPPKINIISPVEDSLYFVNFYNPDVHVQVEEPNLKQSQLTLDRGISWVYFGKEIKFTMENIPSIGQGNMLVKAEDIAGNVAQDSVTFHWTHWDVEALAIPRNLKAVNVWTDSIELDWDYYESEHCINWCYRIYVDDQLVDTSYATSYTLTNCSPGHTYTIAVSALAICFRGSYILSDKSDTIQVTTLDLTIGVGKLKLAELGEVQIFFNLPYARLHVKLTDSARYIIKISDLNGKVLYTRETTGPTNQIDISSFQKGIYFITVQSRDYVRTEKIIKL